ncbi:MULTISPECIES: inner membrane protein YbjM [unclassified Erwinia]|uniref:inner membrane protein YbjM n=1 Tax=unclassified Erwinia TaxID=2622719 RepID=UPI0011773A78|nr:MULTISPECIES: inner membrane protein YbjM [unclassified Erwinia]
MFKSLSWSGVGICTVCYGVIFFVVRYHILRAYLPVHQGQLAMLLFLLPGAVAGLLSKKVPLMMAVVAGVLATPFCLLLVEKGSMPFHSFWQECAFVLSAIYWCGLGALAVMLCRMFGQLRRREQ